MNFDLFQKHSRGHPTLLGENSSYSFFFFHLNIDRLLMNNSKSPIPIWLTCAKPLVCHACLPTTAPAAVQSCELHQILPSIIPGRPMTLKHISGIGRRPRCFRNPLASPNLGKNVLEKNVKSCSFPFSFQSTLSPCVQSLFKGV